MFYLMGFGHYLVELSGGLPISRSGHVLKGRLGTKNEYNGAPNDISTREC